MSKLITLYTFFYLLGGGVPRKPGLYKVAGLKSSSFFYKGLGLLNGLIYLANTLVLMCYLNGLIKCAKQFSYWAGMDTVCQCLLDTVSERTFFSGSAI